MGAGARARRRRTCRHLGFHAACTDQEIFYGMRAGFGRDRLDRRGPVKEASTHWLRHTHGMHAVESGMPLDVVQQNMGHESLDTTTIYVTAEQRRRIKAMTNFWQKTAERSAPTAVAAEEKQDISEEIALANGPQTVWRIKVALLGVRPTVWRRIETFPTVSLSELHAIIQSAMGWELAHLYAFHDAHGDGQIDAGVMFDDVCRPGESLRYQYDFGDDWQHLITVEQEGNATAGARYPRCVGGKNACPPEDCGGPWGYADLVRTLAGRSSPRGASWSSGWRRLRSDVF